MGLRDTLRRGDLGVRCELPPGDLRKDGEREVFLLDPEILGGAILVRHLPWRMDHAAASRGTRRDDVERTARLAFAEAFVATIHPVTGEPVSPRTDDPSWSPVVEVDDDALGGHGLWVARRVSYAPTDELHGGGWLVPLADGVLSIELLAREQGATNYRECLLLIEHDKAHPERAGTFPPQSFYDDPSRDQAFPGHPLSRVRATRRWFEDPVGGGFAVLAPPPPAACGEQTLVEAKCVVDVPPRYVRLPHGTLDMGPTLVSFTRVTPGGSIDHGPGLLMIGRHPRAPLRPSAAALRAWAVERVKGWGKEGVKDIEIDVRTSESDHGPVIDLHIRFRTGTRCQEVQRWFTTEDGAVFHVGCSEQIGWPTALLRDDVLSVQRSLRSLEPPAPPPPPKPVPPEPPPRPWWRFGF